MSLADWADSLEPPAGVGVDMVEIEEIKALDERTKGVFVQRTFTQKEREEADASTDKWSYYAGRFATKEAVFKALAPLTPEKAFDFRIVETLRAEDGSPHITQDGLVRQYGILNNKWGELLCQKRYQTRNTHQNLRNWW